MIHKSKKSWPGNGLILAGIIVLVVGLSVALFKEFNIPGHWIPAVAGAALLVAGIVIRGIRGDNDVHDQSHT